jgi:tetratricopeptide (TPR) repeat protein
MGAGPLLRGVLLTAAALAAGASAARAADEVPGAVAEELDAADRAFLRGDWSAAQIRYGRVLREAPELRRALWGRAAALLRLRREFEALPLLRRALGPSPTFDELAAAARLTGEAARGEPWSGRAAAAHEFLIRADAAARRGPEGGARVEDRAWVAWAAGRYDDAIDSWNAVPGREPYRLFVAALASDVPTRPDPVDLPAPKLPAADPGLGLDGATWDRVARFLFRLSQVALAWGCGLLALYLAGEGLSWLILRTADRDGRGRPIPPWQRPLRWAYRVVIWSAGLYYYVSLAVLVAVVLAVPGSVVYGLATAPRVPGLAVLAALPLSLVLVVLGVPLARSLRVQFVETTEGRPLREEEAQGLWALAREVAGRVGTRPVDEIRLVTGAGIAVQERGRWRDKRRGRSVRCLRLGMATFDGFAPDDFRAVLAHEYAHFLHGDTVGHAIARRVEGQLNAFGSSIVQWNGNAWWNGAWHFARCYHALFQRIISGERRLRELHADRVSVLTYGPRAAADGLRHTLRADAEYRLTQEWAFRAAVEGPMFLENPMRSVPAIRGRAIREIVDSLIKAPARGDDTHPSPARRLELFETIAAESRQEGAGDGSGDGSRPRAGPAAVPDGGLWSLFADLEKAREEFRRRCDADLQARLDQHAAVTAQVIAHHTAAVHDNPGQAPALFARANAHCEAGDYRAAVADYDRAADLSPHTALYRFNRGHARLRLGDPAGASDDLRAAMRLSRVALEPPARVALGDISAAAGDFTAAVEEYSRAIELDSKDPSLCLKRGNARARLGRHGAAVADFTRAIELDPESAEAHVARAHSRAALDDLAPALADAERAVALDPALAEAHAALARLLATAPDLSLRDRPRSLAHARRALALTGGRDPIALEALAAAEAEDHEPVAPRSS